jgi:hypothetical protein
MLFSLPVGVRPGYAGFKVKGDLRIVSADFIAGSFVQVISFCEFDEFYFLTHGGSPRSAGRSTVCL